MTKDGHHHLHIISEAAGAELQLAVPNGERTRHFRLRLEFYPDPDSPLHHWDAQLVINAHTGTMRVAYGEDGDD